MIRISHPDGTITIYNNKAVNRYDADEVAELTEAILYPDGFLTTETLECR